MGDNAIAFPALLGDKFSEWAVMGGLGFFDEKHILVFEKGNAPSRFIIVGQAAMFGKFVEGIIDVGWLFGGHRKKLAHDIFTCI